MLRAFTATLSRFRNHLTRLDDQPLGRAALVIVIGLDLFILTSIFDGLARHTAQLARPTEYIPGVCTDIVVSGRWNATSRMERLAGIVVRHETSPHLPREKRGDRHPLCAPLLSELDAIKNDKTLASGFTALQRLSREAQDLRAQIERLKGPYDTALLETIARQPGRDAQVATLKAQIDRNTGALDKNATAIAAAEAPLARSEHVLRLWALIDAVTESDRERLRDDLRSLNFWFPVKRLGMELLFLLPLMAVSYGWNAASIRGNRGVQVLVSAHLLTVTAVPVVFKVAELVYEIVPKKLLQQFFELLESLKLVALWHYLIIALAIAAALALVYLFQRKLFSRAKILERRIAGGQCQQCGRGLPAGARICPFCGFGQFTTCRHCQQPTYVYGRFCTACGQQL